MAPPRAGASLLVSGRRGNRCRFRRSGISLAAPWGHLNNRSGLGHAVGPTLLQRPALACGGLDCNDQDNTINPSAAEAPCNGVDDNCDTVIDEGRANVDGDAFDECSDCDDTEPFTFPGA